MITKHEIEMVENIVKVNEILIKTLAEITNNEDIQNAIALNEEIKRSISYQKSLNHDTNTWSGKW